MSIVRFYWFGSQCEGFLHFGTVLHNVLPNRKTAREIEFPSGFSLVEAMGVELFSERKEIKN